MSPHHEEAPGPSVGPVVLDIGGRFGAAVVRTAEELDGSEIEIRREGTRWDGTHVAIRARAGFGHPVFAAVFGHLEEGPYELRLRHAQEANFHRVEVIGGEVSDTSWPSAAVASPGAVARTVLIAEETKRKEHERAC
jgi:hypothetical protein